MSTQQTTTAQTFLGSELRQISVVHVPQAGQMTQRIADWHGQQAAKAYSENDMARYLRHVAIADKLWG